MTNKNLLYKKINKIQKLKKKEWRNNKVLLYSTGNYIQYLLIYHNEKYEKNNVYIGITESPCCIPVTNTTIRQ